MRSAWSRLGFLALLNAAAGCHGSPSSSSASVIAPDQFAAQRAAAVCAFTQRCQAISSYAACDPAALTTAGGTFSRTASAGRVSFDAGHAQACLEAINALACPIYAAAFDSSLLDPPDCQATVAGQVAVGGDCYGTGECAKGFCDLSSCPGKCVAYAQTGTACSAVSTPCDFGAGLRCIKGHCAARLAAGAGCGNSADCQPGLFCSYASPRQCTAYGTGSAGAACRSIEECAQGFYCLRSRTGRACTAQVQAGGACAEDGAHVGAVASECALGLVCAGYSYDNAKLVATPGLCAHASDIGGPCKTIVADPNVVANTGCLAGLVCSNGTCAAPPNTGACAEDPSGGFPQCDQRKAYCDTSSGTCGTLVGDGAVCATSDQCKSGACDLKCLPRCSAP